MPSVAGAATAEEFYKGRPMTLIMSADAGGGYASYANAFAPYLSKHIPGNPRITVQYMPGAGGLRAMNYLYNNAPKDGSVIGMVHSSVPYAPLYGLSAARFDPRKFGWLGSLDQSMGICVAWASSGIQTWQDMMTKGLVVGSSGAGSQMETMPMMLNKLFGSKNRVISGYKGGNEVYLAMERGEVDGFPSLFYNTLNATRPKWREEKNLKLILQYGLEKEPALPDVPSAIDLVTNPEDKQLLQTGLAQVTMGRPYLMPPGVPEDRVAIMRKAFEDTLKDRAFLADARRLSLGVRNSRTGPQVQAVLEEAYKTPPNIVARLRTLSLH
jgi:tripartite-type tricarboxylate transporter receptor subunit TctC